MKAEIISFVVAQVPHTRGEKHESAQVQTAKSAPRYFSAAIPPKVVVDEESASVGKNKGSLTVKSYPADVLLAEVRFAVKDVFSHDVIALREQAVSYCEKELEKRGGKNISEFGEAYAIFAVSGYTGEPEQFLKFRDRIAGLLKSEKLPLDAGEVSYTLSSQMKYTKNDLAIVDWDGAFLFDQEADFDTAIALLELANVQLLRYRVLDAELDERLLRAATHVKGVPFKRRFLFTSGEIDQALKETILARSWSIANFQAVEREIKLIGDWYSARLYELASKKLKLDEWRKTVKEKVDAIESVYAIASQNFSLSWDRGARVVEMIGWYVLLVGWLALLILDIYFYKK